MFESPGPTEDLLAGEHRPRSRQAVAPRAVRRREIRRALEELDRTAEQGRVPRPGLRRGPGVVRAGVVEIHGRSLLDIGQEAGEPGQAPHADQFLVAPVADDPALGVVIHLCRQAELAGVVDSSRLRRGGADF